MSRSLCNKLTEFQGFAQGNGLGVVAVTETWLHDGVLHTEILQSDAYTMFRKGRGDIISGDGILIVVKSYILAYRRRDLEPRNSEILVCEFFHQIASK